MSIPIYAVEYYKGFQIRHLTSVGYYVSLSKGSVFVDTKGPYASMYDVKNFIDTEVILTQAFKEHGISLDI